jgi:hypothetical protein
MSLALQAIQDIREVRERPDTLDTLETREQPDTQGILEPPRPLPGLLATQAIQALTLM